MDVHHHEVASDRDPAWSHCHTRRSVDRAACDCRVFTMLRVSAQSDLAYGADAKQRLDLFVASTGADSSETSTSANHEDIRPTIIFIHGGLWVESVRVLL